MIPLRQANPTFSQFSMATHKLAGSVRGWVRGLTTTKPGPASARLGGAARMASNGKRPSAIDSLPENLRAAWSPVPRALWQHGGALGLTGNDKAIIAAMWSRKWYADSKISAAASRLAEEAGVSHATLKRRLAWFQREGLVKPVRTGKPGSRVIDWDLFPLWHKLAAVAHRELPDPEALAHPEPPSSSYGATGVAHPEPPLAQPELQRRGRKEDDSKEKGGKKKPPPTTDDVGLANELRRAAADPSTFAGNKVKLLKQADDLDRKARTEDRLAAVHRLMNPSPEAEVIEEAM